MQNDMAFFLHVWLQTQPTWDFLTLSLHILKMETKGPVSTRDAQTCFKWVSDCCQLLINSPWWQHWERNNVFCLISSI